MIIDSTKDQAQLAAKGGADLLVMIEELNQEREYIYGNILFIDTKEAVKRLAEINAQEETAKMLHHLHNRKRKEFFAGLRSAA